MDEWLMRPLIGLGTMRFGMTLEQMTECDRIYGTPDQTVDISMEYEELYIDAKSDSIRDAYADLFNKTKGIKEQFRLNSCINNLYNNDNLYFISVSSKIDHDISLFDFFPFSLSSKEVLKRILSNGYKANITDEQVYFPEIGVGFWRLCERHRDGRITFFNPETDQDDRVVRIQTVDSTKEEMALAAGPDDKNLFPFTLNDLQ